MSGSSEIQAPLSPYTYHLHPYFSPYNSLYGYHPDSQPFGSFGLFLLTLQLYHPSPSHTLGLFNPFHHVHNKKQNSGCTYVVKLLNNCIKKCRGCRAAFSWKVDGSLPEPPNNLVLCHEEQRPFSEAKNVIHVWIDLNVYYHPIHNYVSCIQRQNPSFVASEIQVSADLELLPPAWKVPGGPLWVTFNYFLTSNFLLLQTSYLCGTVTIYVHLSTVSKIVNCKIRLGTLFLYVYLPLMIGDKIPEEEPLGSVVSCCWR